MSLRHTEVIECGRCGNVDEIEVLDTLDAGSHPVLKQMVLQRRLHRYECSGCNRTYVVDKPLLYVDWGRRQFLVTFPLLERPNEMTLAPLVLQLFERNLRLGPAPIAAHAHEFLVRLCFGYEELREKIVVDDYGLADLTVESLKCEILTADPFFRIGGAATLRLDTLVGNGDLKFFPEGLVGEPIDTNKIFITPRARYDEMHAHYETLLKRRPWIAMGPYCSVLRALHLVFPPAT